MSAQIVDRTLRVAVGGFSYSVAECGEQLAWLAVALQRLSPRRLCVPYLVGKDFNLVGKPPGGTHPIHIRLGDYVALDSNVLLPPSGLGSEPSATLEKTSEGRVSDGTNVPASGTSFDWIPSNGSRATAHSTVTTTISTGHEESLDSDMLSISDRSDRFNPFGQEPAVSVIFSEIFHRLLDDWRLTRCCQSSSEQSSQSSSSAPQTGSTSTQVQSQESRTQGNQKRRQQDLDCSDDGFGDGDSGSSRPRKKAKNGMVPRKCFACPFWKKNPRTRRDCFGYKLSLIKDVKQHLARQHTQSTASGVCKSSKTGIAKPSTSSLTSHASADYMAIWTASPTSRATTYARSQSVDRPSQSSGTPSGPSSSQARNSLIRRTWISSSRRSLPSGKNFVRDGLR